MSQLELIGIMQRVMAIKSITETGWSEISGVPQPTINRILSGITIRPRAETIERLAGAVGLTSAQLQGLEIHPDWLRLPPSNADDSVDLPLLRLSDLEVAYRRGMSVSTALKFGVIRRQGSIPSPLSSRKRPPGHSLYVVISDSSAMYPEYRKDELLFITSSWNKGMEADVIVHHGGKVLFRRYQRNSEGEFLVAMNNRWLDPIIKFDKTTKVLGVCFFSGLWRENRAASAIG